MSELILKLDEIKESYDKSIKNNEKPNRIYRDLESKVRIGIECNAYGCVQFYIDLEEEYKDKILKVDNIKINYNNKHKTINISSDKKYEEQFVHFIDDIYNGIKELNNEDDIVNQINLKIKQWKHFIGSMIKNDEKLTYEQEIGLFGELKTLECLMEYLEYKKAVQSWVGPDRQPKDFIIDDVEIETKTTTNKYIKINGIEQLTPGNNNSLFINIHKIIEDNEGETLKELIDKIIKNISEKNLDEKQYIEDLLMTKLIASKYNPRAESNSNKKYIVNSKFYSVEDTFPRIQIEDNMKRIIKNVSYSIDISFIEANFMYKDINDILNNNKVNSYK